MKDLTFYLKCSPKQSATKETDTENNSAKSKKKENIKAPNNNEKSNENRCNEELSKTNAKADKKTDSNKIDNEPAKSCHKRHKKRSKFKKPSDPVVKNITEKLNSSLSIISPNTSSVSTSKDEIEAVRDGEEKDVQQISPGTKPRRSSSDFEVSASLSKSRLSNTATSLDKAKDTTKLKCEGINTMSRGTGSEFKVSCKSVNKDKKQSMKVDDATESSRGNKSKSSKLTSEDSKKKHLEKSHKKELLQDQSSQTKKQSVNHDFKNSPEKSKLKHEKETKRAKNSEKSKSDLIEIKTQISAEQIEILESSNDEINSTSIELTSVEIMECKTPKVKVNAFQFLMESRYKSIGQNSSGKEACAVKTDTQEERERREKRQSRKAALENWVENKIDTKRKRKEEEEKETYINRQLKKRAKRLKKLLNASSDGVEQDFVPQKSPRKRIMKPVIFSDSENSLDSIIIVEQTVTEVTSTDTRADALLNKDGDKNKENLNVYEHTSEKKIKSNQDGLVSFLGIANKLNKDDKCEAVECERNKNSQVLAISSSQVEANTPKTRRSKRHSKLKIKQDEKSEEENANLCFEDNKTENEQELSENVAVVPPDQDGDYITENSCSQDLDKTSANEMLFTPDVKKRKRRKQNMEDHLILSKSPRTWKMRIRLTSEDENNTQSSILEEKLVRNNEAEQSVLTNNVEEVRNDKEGSRSEDAVKITLSSDSDDEVLVEKEKQSKKPIKIAPMFLKATPKKKIDPQVVEARRQFLMSGIPDRLKRDIEKQVSLEDIEFDVFPATSHVQQKSPSNNFWDMPYPQIKLSDLSPYKNAVDLVCETLTEKDIPGICNILEEAPKQIQLCKQYIDQIKSENSSYPVYKSFKSIYEKSGLKEKKEKQVIEEPSVKKKTPKRGRPKKKKSIKLDDSVEIIEEPKTKPNFSPADYAMWTEKYKPSVSSDIIGNASSVQQLKKWLEKWTETNDDSNLKKKRKRTYSSSSEFEYTDGDSKDSCCSSQVKNTVILRGPHGCGKSVAVYAVCNELGMNVLELNASSKRTGKRLLQELQEATQSHQVHKDESNAMSQFLKRDKTADSKKDKTSEQCHNEDQQLSQKKICVLLVEDVDIVFEQDEGFFSALSQLIATSKRPIILTTTNDLSQNIQKFMSQHAVISFTAITAYSLSTWLQILCLVEGAAVDRHMLGVMLEKNNGDVRKTLLQLQFWVQSGGDLRKLKTHSLFDVVTVKHKRSSCDEKLTEDDSSNISGIDVVTVEEKLVYQTACLESFEQISSVKTFNIPYSINVSKLWWNLPNILSLDSKQISEKDCVDKECLTGSSDSGVDSENSQKDKQITHKQELAAICNVYDTLVFTDLNLGHAECMVDLEPSPRQWDNRLGDSLELNQRLEEYNGNDDLSRDICHSLTDGYVGLFKKLKNHSISIDLGMPSYSNRRWRAKQHLCEDILQDALSLSCYLDRRSVSMDFMPMLRNIARAEMVRASHNTKRGNRFNNYLRGLGVDTKETSCSLICNVLKSDKFK